ncbi:MAG: hypothetical protein IH969_03510, partial [Candidatus Krumholzibacteriota bacterium]|nr:hypothetical protein [Candidatus Krumholzibacteriota bacterium]
TYRRDTDMKVSLVGTPAYMAPEIIRGETPLTRAVDYYSLGATLFQLLAGRQPFEGTAKEILRAHLEEEPWFEEEHLEHTELYPHALALMSKDQRTRLEGFEKFRRATAGRVGGTVDAFERAIGISHIESLGLIGHADEWQQLGEWAGDVAGASPSDTEVPRAQLVVGSHGSGKTYLTEMMLSELAVAGVRIFRADENNPAPGTSLETIDYLPHKAKRAQNITERHSTRWDVMDEGPGPAVIVFDGVDQMDETGHAFLGYVNNRVDLAITTKEDVRVFSVIVSADGSQESTFNNATRLVVTPTTRDDVENIHERIGPAIHKADESRLQVFIRDHSDTLAQLIRSLEYNIAGDTMRYQGGLWQVGQELSSPPEAEDSAAAFTAAQMMGLPGHARELLQWVSCQPHGMPVTMLASLRAMTEASVVQEVDDLREYRLVELVQKNRVRHVMFSSDRARQYVYERIEKDERDAMHRSCIDALSTSGEPKTDDLIALGYHHAAMGDLREMARTHLKAINHLTESNDSPLVAKLYLFGLESLTRDGGHEMLARFYLKKAVHGGMRASNFGSVRHLVTTYLDRTGQRTLLTLIYPYSRALFKQSAADVWQDTMERARPMVRRDHSEPHLRLLLCEASRLRTLSEMRVAAGLLGEVREHVHRLDPRTKGIFHSFEILSARDIGSEDDDLLDRIARAQELTARHGLLDEHIMVTLEKVSYYVDLGKYRDAMREVVTGTKMAVRNHLYDRQYGLRFKTATVYHQMGDYERALRHMTRAHRLAISLGDRSRVLETVTRFAMNHELLGNFGNALRYAALAEELLTEATNQNARMKTLLYHWQLMLLLGNPRIEEQRAAVESMIGDIQHVPTVAYFHLVRGKYHFQLSNLSDAYASFLKAKELFESAAFLDDAAISAMEAARCAIEMGDAPAVSRELNFADRTLAGMESANIQAYCISAKLQAFLGMELFADEISELVQEATDVLENARDVTIRLELDRTLFETLAALGRDAEADAAFQRFLEASRHVVASFEDSDDAKRYAVVSGLDETMDDYDKWRNRQ